MHDKAHCHFSASTQRYLAIRGVVVLAWPRNSPDLNPIEKRMGHYEEKHDKMPNNKTKLWEDVSSVWYSFSRQTLMELYDSMPKRVQQAVYKAKGGPFQY